MNLMRSEFRPDGIFGQLIDEDGTVIAQTLEHAYQQADGSWAPKTPEGTYTCQRSPHRLHGMTQDFETFQIMNVPGHSNILIHWGNYNKDSDGCVLVGAAIAQSPQGQMITNSKVTFAQFMQDMVGKDQFTLTVV